MIREEIFNSATIDGMIAAPGMKWHRDPPDVIPLWLAEPDFPIAPEIKRALLNAVHDEDLFYGTDKNARDAMASKVTSHNGLDVSADDIMITQGVIPAMWLAIRFSCGPGDEVIVNDPMYQPFITATDTTGTRSVRWPLEMDDGYKFDIEILKNLITERTKLIFICNPHNPCGRVMTKEELKGISDIAEDNGIVVMVDELWEDIIFDGKKHITFASLSPEIADLTMTSWGFSKTYGVAGLQMGYLCATNEEMMAKLKKLARGVFRGASNLALAAASVMLDETLSWWRIGVMNHLRKIRDMCESRFEEVPGVTCLKPEGTYLLFPRFNYEFTSEELEKFLFEKARLRFSVGTHFGSRGEGHLRMSIATSEHLIDEAFNRMQEALKNLK